MTATIFYQAMTYSQHPDYSLTWISGLISAFLLVLAGLWLTGKNILTKHGGESVSDLI